MRSLTVVALLAASSLFGAATAPFPDPAIDQERPTTKGKQTAVFAGGCFWCMEAVFEHVAGVQKVISGYAGGDAATAHYKIVGEGSTDHAESIEITYDPSRITYGQLLKIFFSVAHDPTQLNRQGPDYGKQYRSSIFYNSPEQKRTAEAYIAQLSAAKVLAGPIVTLVVPLTKFYPAEDYHQDFVKNNPDHPYVVANALPKLQKLKKLYPDLIKR